MTFRSCLTAMVVLGALICFAPAGFADDEPAQGNDIRDKIKAQMQKILDLMKANEQALLKLSAGDDAKTRKVDVKVDTPEGESGSASSSDSEGSGSKNGGANGEAIREGLDELLKAQSGSGSIPPELEELVRMIPT